MAALALVAASCSDDDEAVNYGAEVAGTYAGEVVMGVKGSNLDPMAGDVQLKSQSNGQLTVSIPSFSDKVMKIPAISIENLQIVAGSTNEYVFSMAQNDTLKTDVNGKIYKTFGVKGTVKDSKLTLNYNMIPGRMPMPLSCEFNGSKK